MDKRVMGQIFCEGLMPRETCCPVKREYKDTMELCDAVEQDLVSNLTPKLAEMFKDYKDYAVRLSTMENEEHFIQGMALGIRITAEAFTLNADKTE
ncbi:MAG: hypothetical protein Q4B70_14990 [Lachnospiraceae bacterium]|nr:hypothetical protein [Lachnospiraceae bacterium]